MICTAANQEITNRRTPPNRMDKEEDVTYLE